MLNGTISFYGMERRGGELFYITCNNQPADWFSSCVDHASTELFHSRHPSYPPKTYVPNKKRVFLLPITNPDASIAINYHPREVNYHLNPADVQNPHYETMLHICPLELFDGQGPRNGIVN